jgi:polar amino acid transport system substrate-binding protein
MTKEGWTMGSSGKQVKLVVLTAVVAVVAASSQTVFAGTSSGNAANDKLAQIRARGTLILSTDPGYPPQSYQLKSAKRLARTKCAANQMTANQMAGYDADTGKLVAKRLGVEACFIVPTWSEIISGHWNDRWDISYGSGAINSDRADRLYFTQPYYAAPQLFFVKQGSKYKRPADLNGKNIGVCAGCTHELYLKRTLTIPGVKVVFKVKNPKISIFDVENPGLKAVADGKIDAFLCAAPEGDGAIHNGLKLRSIKEPAFFMYPTGFVDRFSAYDVTSFVAKVDQIVQELHADGTLRKLSKRDFFSVDYATKAGQFDMKTIGQVVK